MRFTGERNFVRLRFLSCPYITDLPSFLEVEHILTECYEDTTPPEDYVKLADADTP